MGFFGREEGKSGVEWKTTRNSILLKTSFVKVFLLDFEISRLQLLPTYLMKGKEKPLPAHINAIKEQYKSSSVKRVLSHQTTGLQDSTIVKKTSSQQQTFHTLHIKPLQNLNKPNECDWWINCRLANAVRFKMLLWYRKIYWTNGKEGSV